MGEMEACIGKDKKLNRSHKDSLLCNVIKRCQFFIFLYIAVQT